MDTIDYAKLADKYQSLPTAIVPTGVPMAGALEIMRHLKADSVHQDKELVRPMVPIVPLAN